MGIQESWEEILFSLNCLQKATAKRQFRHAIRYAWGGLCAYCRSNRATTVDHLKPRCRGGTNLRSNLIPCCVECNHSKGSEDWETWFKKQPFYSDVAHELISEWIANKRYDHDHETEPDEKQLDDRAEVCINKSRLRSRANEPTCA